VTRFLSPEWVIVYITAIYVVISGLTLKAIKRQADLMSSQATDMENQVAEMKKQAVHMEGQLRLQEVQFKQWVKIGLWKNLTPPLQPDATEVMVTLSFEIGNPTQFPFTLRKVAIKKGGESSASSNMQHLIAPDDFFTAFKSFDITPTELELYRLDKLTATIEIETEIRDVLQKECAPQHFRQTVIFGPNRCEATEDRPHYGMRLSLVPVPVPAPKTQ